MWDKMAKEPKLEAKKPIKIEKPKVEKKSYFPKLLMLFGLLVMAWALNGFFGWYPVPELATNIILLLSGWWMLKKGIASGFYKKRKEIFKKYI